MYQTDVLCHSYSGGSVTLSTVCMFELKYTAANCVDQHVWSSSSELSLVMCMKTLMCEEFALLAVSVFLCWILGISQAL